MSPSESNPTARAPSRRRAPHALIVVTLAAVCGSGCATIVHGPTQDVAITSEPPGADVTIDGKEVGKTPLRAKLPRKDAHSVEVASPGFEPRKKDLVPAIDNLLWANCLCIGVGGIAIDYFTGSMYTLGDDAVRVSLAPGAGPTAPGTRVAGATPATVASSVAASPKPAAPSTPPPKTMARVLVLETRADKTHVDEVKAFGDLLATILEKRTSAEIVPSSSVKDRLTVAHDKMEAGCDDTACMSEIAGALDARYVITSRASQIGGRWSMRVELFDSQDLQVVAQKTVLADSITALANQAEAVADALVTQAPVLRRRG